MALIEANVQQPSFLDDDFEVIEDNQTSISNSMSPYEIPHEQHQSPESVPSPEHLVDQLVTANERCASLRQVLAGSNSSLASLIHTLSEKQKQVSAGLEDYQQTRQELSKLKISQEEWQQTTKDYQTLKNQYNLLINTKERLESERDELLDRLANNLPQASTEVVTIEKDHTDAKVEAQAHEEQLCLAIETERKKWEVASRDDLEAIKKSVYSLEDQLKQKNDELTSIKIANDHSEQQRLHLRNHVEELSQQIIELENEVEAGKTSLRETVRRQHVELEDLSLNSDVSQLLELRRELERCQKREEEQQKIYRESDQTINEIYAECENEKRTMQSELQQLKHNRNALETSLIDLSRKLEEVTGREMVLNEEIVKQNEQIQRARGIHQIEMQQLEEKLRTTQLRHQCELDAHGSASQQKDLHLQATQRQLDVEKRTVETLSRRVESLEKACHDKEKLVNDVLVTAEAEKKVLQDQLDSERGLRASAEAQLRTETASHLQATAAMHSLRRHVDDLQAVRLVLERQLADCRAKAAETTVFTDQLRTRLQAEMTRCGTLEADLNALKAEHTRVRTGYDGMQRRLAELLAQEQGLTTRVKDAEETNLVLRNTVEHYRRDYVNVQQESNALKAERDSLLVQLRGVRNAIGQS